MSDDHDDGLLSPFQTFDPEETGSRRKFKAVPFRLIAPNIVTLMALCAGLTSVRMAIEGRFELALIAVFAAAFLDAADGRVARMLKGTSRFGAELDSLTDFVNFGVAPALILHVWILNALPTFGWIASLLFAIAMVLRLARFNVALDERNRPAWQMNFFVGVPAPAGALAVLAPVYLELAGLPHYEPLAFPVLLYTLFIAMLVVSSLPTYSGKTIGLKIPRAQVLPLMGIVVVAVAILFSYPWISMTLIVAGYLGSIPFARRAWHAQNRAHEEEEARRVHDEVDAEDEDDD